MREVDYTSLLDLLLETYEFSKERRILISIGGCSRTGKTTLAKQIQKDMSIRGINCGIVALDNWLVGVNGRRNNGTVRERFQYKDIRNAVAKLVAGEDIRTPVYNSKTRSVIDDEQNVLHFEDGVIILDGVVALDIPELRAVSKLKVFVDIDDTIRSERLNWFYLEYKNCTQEEASAILNARELEEVPLIKSTIQYADVVFRAS